MFRNISHAEKCSSYTFILVCFGFVWTIFQCPSYFTLACATTSGCHSPRTRNRFMQNHCSPPCETLIHLSSIIKTQNSSQSLIVTFLSAAWLSECTNQPDSSEFVHGFKVPDAHSLHYWYHISSQACRETILIFLQLWRYHISVFAGPLASIFRHHSSERKGFHVFCFLTDSFGHCSETHEL